MSKIEDDGTKHLWVSESYKMCYSFIRCRANKSQLSVGRVSAECRQSIDWLVVCLGDYQPTWVSRYLVDCPPTVNRDVDRVSIEISIEYRLRCWSSIHRGSIEMLIEGIDRLLTVDAFSTRDPKKIRLQNSGGTQDTHRKTTIYRNPTDYFLVSMQSRAWSEGQSQNLISFI